MSTDGFELIAGEGDSRAKDLGWHTMSGELLLATLRRAHAGEDPDLLMAELWANADTDYVPGDDAS